MKFMAISLIFFLIPLAGALEFDFSFPESVVLETNFSVSISADVSTSYDIKILIEDNETGTTISEIYNNGWKNPYYYLQSVFPDQTNFLIRATTPSDNAIICVRMRKTGSSPSPLKCKSIFLQSKTSESTKTKSSETSEESNKTDSQSKIISLSPNEDFIPAETKESSQQIQESASNKIILNSGNAAKNELTTKDGNLRIYSIYAFTAFVILILSFLVMKKL